MHLSQLGSLFGAPSHPQDASFESVSIDSRTIEPGALFIAIKGENFDGHDFIQSAFQKGAVAAIVSTPVNTSSPLFIVKDTRLALGQLAAVHRSTFTLPLIALTGSNGKTTTKEMIASILRMAGETLATSGNLNNDIGAPLTLLKLNSQHQFAVIELGTNHPGEIAYSSQLAKPTIALITNVGRAHTAGLGSLEKVAAEKGQIYQALSVKGSAVINNDDAFAKDWLRQNHQRKIVTFGIQTPSDFMAEQISLNAEGFPAFKLVTPLGRIDIQLPLPGMHNVMNALAAAASTHEAGLSLSQIASGLETVQPVKGRLHLFKTRMGGRLIDDTYNANPNSVRVAIDFLSQFPGKKILVLGDMGELGENASEYHYEIGQFAKKKGIHALYTCGKLSLEASKAFGENAQHFPSQSDLIPALQLQLGPDVSCLIKGSRSAKMETIVSYFKQEQG